ncbi:MAG: acyl--CoA ligase, partial [Desulfovibrio sp.]|nr:acyl--CoA ligase [Desulfovibrio sp.]
MSYSYDVTMFKETFEHEFTWLNGFLRNVHRFANQGALFSPLDNTSWTYKELNEASNRLAHAMQADCVGKNDCIMFMLFNSPEFIFTYIAGHKLGAINCPVNYRQSSGELAAIMEDSRPVVFLYDASMAKIVRSALELSVYKPKRLICVNRFSEPQRFESDNLCAVLYDDYIRGMRSDNPTPDALPHIYDESTRLYTSGTTHRARAVPINTLNEVLSAHDVMMHFPLNNTDRTMNMTPWFHRGGLHSGGPTPTLYAGGEVIILREFNPRVCLQYVTQHKVTFLIGVPSIIALLARAQERQPADLQSLRGIVTMGSPFEKSACEK